MEAILQQLGRLIPGSKIVRGQNWAQIKSPSIVISLNGKTGKASILSPHKAHPSVWTAVQKAQAKEHPSGEIPTTFSASWTGPIDDVIGAVVALRKRNTASFPFEIPRELMRNQAIESLLAKLKQLAQ